MVRHRCLSSPIIALTDFLAKWNNTAFYVVGKATATAFRSSSIPPSRILGADSGTGEALARFIVSNHDTHHDGDYGIQPSFLLLTGDKNRDTISVILTEAGFNFRKLQVYGTTATSNLDTNMASAMEAMKGSTLEPSKGYDQFDSSTVGQESPYKKPWIVFFSPSTADVVIPAIRQNPLSSFRIATIGPTTAAHIRSLNYDVCVSSPKPDPGVLAESLLVYTASV
jgi:uroporphyrinogen-III synthase